MAAKRSLGISGALVQIQLPRQRIPAKSLGVISLDAEFPLFLVDNMS
jgi:hypothetical protein